MRSEELVGGAHQEIAAWARTYETNLNSLWSTKAAGQRAAHQSDHAGHNAQPWLRLGARLPETKHAVDMNKRY